MADKEKEVHIVPQQPAKPAAPAPKVTAGDPEHPPGERPNEPYPRTAKPGEEIPMQPGGPPYIPANPSLYPPGDPPKFSPEEAKKHRESDPEGAKRDQHRVGGEDKGKK